MNHHVATFRQPKWKGHGTIIGSDDPFNFEMRSHIRTKVDSSSKYNLVMIKSFNDIKVITQNKKSDDSIGLSSRSFMPNNITELNHSHPENTLAIKSGVMIEENIRNQLVKLIKPLQNILYNYKDPAFVNSGANKLKIQELIPQFQHFQAYKQLKSLMLDRRKKCRYK